MIEINTAVTNSIANVNTEIQIFQDQFQGLIQLVETINNSLTVDQTKLVLDELSAADIVLLNNSMINDLGNFSDLIIQRGKDILLLADQAQQFICVSNDAFDRVVDTWNWLTSRDMESTIIAETNKLKTLVINIKDSINNRVDLISDAELLVTETLLENGIIALREILDTIISTITNIILIFKKSQIATNVFKNVLAVNTTVGIALAVTQRAWDIMIRMNQHNYKTVSTVLDQQVTTASSGNLVSNALYPVSMIEREKQINSWMNKMLVTPGANSKIEIGSKIYKFTNKKDANYTPAQLPSEYNTLSTPQIVEQYSQSMQDIVVPDILLPIMYDAAMIQAIGPIMHSTLTDWYNTQVEPNYLLDDLIKESESPEFVVFHNKYLSNFVIQETIQNILTKKQKLQMRDSLIEHGEISAYPQDIKIANGSKYNFEGNELLAGTQAQVAFQQFLNDEIIRIKDSAKHLETIDAVKSLYRNKLIPETGSGQFTLAMYSKDIDGKEILEKVIEQFKYSYLLYKDDLKIHYIEAKINKYDYFLINNNLIQTNYTFSEDLAKLVTFIETSVHDVNLLVQYHGYLVDFDYTAPSYKVQDMDITVDGIVEDKLNGIKKVLTSTYKNSLDAQGLNIITKTKDETDHETHWVTNNTIERVTTDITNIYRTELIKGNMDFTQARVNSIVSTLRFLGYREELDAYIDDTWLYGVPRYVAQPE